MAKSGLILTDVDAPGETYLNSGSSMQNGVVTIPKVLWFKVPDADNPRDYSDIDVYSHPNFPQKNAALAADARYKFYGNAKIERENPDSRFFHAELEYSTENPNAKDSDGNTVTGETPPWKLRPENISFSYPEINVPFTQSYSRDGILISSKNVDRWGNPVEVPSVPVVNSAGDPFTLETTVRNVRMSFTFAARSWDPNNSLAYGNTVNSSDINVCGVKIPAGWGILEPPECEYITVYEDNSSSIKWQYWQIRCAILIDMTGRLVLTKVVNLGDRAKFPAIQYTDALITAAITLPASNGPEQIVRFRKLKKETYNSGKYDFIPTGDNVFAGWSQFLAVHQKVKAITLDLKETDKGKYQGGIIDLQCEQLTQMPLKATGANEGQLDTDAITNKTYATLTFRKYGAKSWAGLNLPKKGVDW